MSIKSELVTVVIPIFNEEDGITQLKEKLQHLQNLLEQDFEVELVFVDDGSRDRTVERLREQFVSHPAVSIVEHGINQGVGAAFRSGFAKARGSFVCTIDADCSYSPEGLLALLHALQATGKDIAVASPYHPEGGVEGVPMWRLALSRACSALYRQLSPLKLYTYTSIFRAYRAAVIQSVTFKADGFVSASEILIAAGRQGFTVTEVPMVLRSRTVGKSKMKVLRTIVSHLEMLSGFVVPARSSKEHRAAQMMEISQEK
ncbi:MAG TPA: glycosyltransferase family 2 protein [Candidatus Angelobacter sp.]|nr:glycosyltransferase family 2 protein [Candidatus Angelobacter sp.]